MITDVLRRYSLEHHQVELLHVLRQSDDSDHYPVIIKYAFPSLFLYECLRPESSARWLKLVIHPNINHHGSIPLLFLTSQHYFLAWSSCILHFPPVFPVAKSALWSITDLSCSYHKPSHTLHCTMHHITTNAPTPASLPPHCSFLSSSVAQPDQRSPQVTTSALHYTAAKKKTNLTACYNLQPVEGSHYWKIDR